MRFLPLVVAASVTLLASVSFAKVAVVTTSTDLSSLIEEIGGEHVSALSIGKANQDIHYIQARPSFMVKLRRADLVVSVGLDLEAAWLPLLLRGARNPKVLPGAPGYLELGDFITPLSVPNTVDASQGHLHPRGNPHYWLDPVRMKDLIPVMAKRLGELDPGNAATYLANAATLSRALEAKLMHWEERMAPYRGTEVISYHDTFQYFYARYGLVNVDTIEAKPGVPPSPKHLSLVINRAKQDRVPVIFHEAYHDKKPSGLVATRSGATMLVLPVSVGAIAHTESYLRFLDSIVESFVSAMEGRPKG